MGWYNREEALAYAKKWAFGRNPIYYNFDPVGGDCTSFGQWGRGFLTDILCNVKKNIKVTYFDKFFNSIVL